MTSNHNHGRDQNIAQTINVQNVPSESVLQKLSGHAAFSALHNSESRGKRTGVHEGTREDFIEKLGGWIEDPDEKGRLYWIRGGAGVGKSAVAQTICEKYAGSRLAASHFFSRNDNSRNSLNRFIPTIAYQLAETHGLDSPLTSEINDVLNTDPRIMEISWEEQFKRLICAPCAALDDDCWSTLPALIVIDGLDECMDRDPETNEIDRKPGRREGQTRLLSMIWNAMSTHPPLPLHFLIFSRPEPTISNFLRSHPFIPALEQFDMRQLRSQANADIELYLRDQFARFPDLHPDAGLEKSWPGEDVIRELTWNADGHFIYVVTVVKYVAGDDPEVLLPQRRLAVVLRTSGNSLYPDLSTLDQLYQHILQPFMGSRKQILLPILQLIISPHRDAGLPYISSTFSPRDGLSCRSRHAIAKLLKLDPREVFAVLSRLHSVLHVPDDQDCEDVSVLHASFADFLIEAQRSHYFHVEPLRDHVYFGMISQCLLPILNDMTRRHAAGEGMPPGITNFEFYCIDVWLFVGVVFDVVDSSYRGMSVDAYIPGDELLNAINEFNVYHYMNMLFDRDYMRHTYTIFPRLVNREDPIYIGAAVFLENVSCIRELHSQCRECIEFSRSTSGSLSPYTERSSSELVPFVNNHRSLFEDGWLTMFPRTCTSNILSQLALIVAVVFSRSPSVYAPYGDLVSDFLSIPKDTGNSEPHVFFKNFPGGMNLAEVPEGSDVWYISREKGRTWADGARTLKRNLGGDSYSRAAGEQGFRAFTTRQFVGLDDWNSEISALLDIWPALEDPDEESDWDGNNFSEWDFADEDGVSLEPDMPDTELEDTEDILDYGQEFPWRLKAPRRVRLDTTQSELRAGEPHQTNDEEHSRLNVVREGLPVGKYDQDHENDEKFTSEFSGQLPMKGPGSEQDQSTRLEDDLPPHEICRLLDTSDTCSSGNEEQRAGDTRIDAEEAVGILGLSSFLRDLWF